MRCRSAERQISLKLDNELKHRHSLALQKHLDSCASCRGIYRQNQALQARLSQLPDPDFPAWLHHRILHNLPKEAKRSRIRQFGLSYATAALSVILSISAGTLVGIKGYESAKSYSQNTIVEDSTLLSFGESSLIGVSYDD